MKRLAIFLATYKLFGITVSTVLAALALQIIGKNKAAHVLLAAVSLVAVIPLLRGMIDDVRNGTYGIDLLAATAIVAAVILREYWAAIVVVLMLTGGEALEDYAERRAKGELNSLLKNAPKIAHVYRKKKLIDISVKALKVGDKIVIKAGEVVPADAIIVEGTASFNESSITGESLPQVRDINDYILSGSINMDGPVTATVTADPEDSQYQQIIKLVRGAGVAHSPFVRLADRYSIPFTILAFAIAGGVWAYTGEAIRFLEVIIVATPCPLLLAAPIALMSGMARASKYGVIVKSGSALEKLAEAKTFAFDKTGTLTTGTLAVSGVTAFGGHSEDEVLALAATLEQSSNHVLAQAIVTAAQDKSLKITKAKHVKEVAGRGVIAQLKGQQVLVGRLSLLEDHDVALPKAAQLKVSETAAYVAVGGTLAGIITLQDEVRVDSEATLRRLKKLGYKNFMMITGDNKVTAAAVGKLLGITNIHADTLPADKLQAIANVTKRPLVFVGDGVNDAPVLTAADIGIAMGARGVTAASETADIVVLHDDIGRVAAVAHIAKRTFAIARQSILIGIALSLILMAVFATGKFPPLYGALLQEVVDVFVIFNALRAHLLKA
ncbi:MAG: heavy metal translocating P-type ATPase [Patescibacteria group bacterium]|nr:heavy metal translocating P-type ATPase [Patescibacteria group bacterium]